MHSLNLQPNLGRKRVHRATDQTIMEWARAQNHVVFTHDLDSGTILAVTNSDSPSVLQVPEISPGSSFLYHGQKIIAAKGSPILLVQIKQIRLLHRPGFGKKIPPLLCNSSK